MGPPVLRSLVVRALWLLSTSECDGWIRSLRTDSGFIVDEDDFRINLLPFEAGADAAGGTVNVFGSMVLSGSTGVAGALVEPILALLRKFRRSSRLVLDTNFGRC